MSMMDIMQILNKFCEWFCDDIYLIFPKKKMRHSLIYQNRIIYLMLMGINDLH